MCQPQDGASKEATHRAGKGSGAREAGGYWTAEGQHHAICRLSASPGQSREQTLFLSGREGVIIFEKDWNNMQCLKHAQRNFFKLKT